jgi:hypothetical protein
MTDNLLSLFFPRSAKRYERGIPTKLALLLNLGQNLRILEQSVLLSHNHISHTLETKKTRKKNKNKNKTRTSSPTLKAFPPQPGNKTRSPALTEVGTICPSLFGAPGPTAITVASGRGLDVAEVGRYIPVAVFCTAFSLECAGGKKWSGGRTVSGLKRWTRTRSRRGTRDLIDLNVAWAAFCKIR